MHVDKKRENQRRKIFSFRLYSLTHNLINVIKKPAPKAPFQSLVHLPGLCPWREWKENWQCKVSLQFLCIDNPIVSIYQDEAVDTRTLSCEIDSLILVFEARLSLSLFLSRSRMIPEVKKISAQWVVNVYKESPRKRHELYILLSELLPENSFFQRFV